MEALIRSSTSNDVYMTNGELPEAIMTGVAPPTLVTFVNLAGMIG
jgi:hypothetical protein